VEFAFALIQHRLRFATGVDWHPKEVCFTHPPPSWSSDYHPTFQCRVRFQESVNRMVIEGDFLEMPLPHGDALLSEILGRHAQRLLNHSASDDGFLTDVRQVLSDGLSRGDVHLKTTANKLALSGRSLQRQLNSRGTSYKEELDRFRRDLALDLLGRQEIGDIVTLLRFSESRAFYRAFRRWTGKTPQEYMSILS
jgi:AraC-like DNA-binding protein